MPTTKQYRKFNGKKYTLAGSYGEKGTATKIAKQWKTRGWNARIVQGTGGNDKWRVYKRYAK